MKTINLKLKNSKLAAIKAISRNKTKMFTIHNKLVDSLQGPLRQILHLSFGSVRGLASRARVLHDFLKLILKIKKNHGSDFTIKWLKACYVALQKSLGDDNLKSLRDLEPGLPLPRLINGIPAVIQSRDRHQIRLGNPKVIIFWSSLFSIYRVLKCSYKLKVSTITDPFKGWPEWFELLMKRDPFNVYFDKLEGFSRTVKDSNLAPRRFRLLRSASSTNSVSWHGLITDVWFTCQSTEQSTNVRDYLLAIQGLGWNITWFREKLGEIESLAEIILNEKMGLPEKCSSVSHFGQFSLKEEAAGKLRVFAIVDSLSQTLLSPLHDFMFALLKLIPNDGTFDQDLSVKRSQSKALSAGKAFSFDLSAATDRLPVDLTVKILSKIFSEEFAKAWKNLMVNRDFKFTENDRIKYNAPADSLRYTVGQPMGALSSWPALALTHHWILQYCSSLLGRTKWEESYEILGDDLVIFDDLLADKYLEVARFLGVEINLNKSISSPKKPVFEFAKRTCLGEFNVSPISLKQLLSNTTLAERAMNLVTFLQRGMVNKLSLVKIALSKLGTCRDPKKDYFKNPLLVTLGILHSMNVIPHRWLVEPIIVPGKDLDELGNTFSIPQLSVVKLIVECGEVMAERISTLSYPYSKEEDRGEIYDDYEPEIANVIGRSAYTEAKALERDLPQIVSKESQNLYRQGTLQGEIPRQVSSTIEGWFDDLLYEEGKFDVVELVDSIESNKAFYYGRMSIEDALKIDDQVQTFKFHFTLTPKVYEGVKHDVAPIMKVISRTLRGKLSGYLKIDRPD